MWCGKYGYNENTQDCEKLAMMELKSGSREGLAPSGGSACTWPSGVLGQVREGEAFPAMSVFRDDNEH